MNVGEILVLVFIGAVWAIGIYAVLTDSVIFPKQRRHVDMLMRIRPYLSEQPWSEALEEIRRLPEVKA